MADIPRFTAQLQSISVPQMKDYEYEQNISIYQTLKQSGERISNTFFELYSRGKMDKKYGTYLEQLEKGKKIRTEEI